MPTWEPLGRHRYYRDRDCAVFELHGDVSLDQIQRVFATYELLVQEHGYSLMVFDATAGAGMGPEARRYVGVRNREDLPEGASVVVGANFAIRALVNLLNNATRLFGKTTGLTFFCATIEQAWPWLDIQRQQLAAKAKQRRG